MLSWAKQFDIFCFLDNQEYSFQPHKYECLLAAGSKEEVPVRHKEFDDIRQLLSKRQWVFGHLSYELGYEFQRLQYSQTDKVRFPLFQFFIPKIVIYAEGEELVIEHDDPEAIYKQLMDTRLAPDTSQTPVQLKEEYSQREYVDTIRQLKEHIHKGDCYEVNFCQSYYAEGVVIDPYKTFRQLSSYSPAPFAALYKLSDKYLISSSPERFVYKNGNRIISQPMKGTVKRDPDDKVDDSLKEYLRNNSKERAENVMIVDLVRNDLSRVSKAGSVKVDELFGVYSFPQVHQMVSTVCGKLETVDLVAIFKSIFPMGSMTGAPKKRVMELIKQYEKSARGIFSGCVGYINPDGDFDFNVVIRSIMYNETSGYLVYKTGSGITFYSDPEKEWEECLWKGAAIKKVLT